MRPHGGRGAAAGLALATLLAVAAPPSGAQPAAAFPDGKWWGSAFGGGEFEAEISGGAGYGEYEFAVEVLGGAVTRGRLTGTAGLGTSAPEGTVDLALSLDVNLGGNARRVTFAGGEVRVQGTVQTEQISAPVDETLPARGGGFSPQSASCLQVSGDLALVGSRVFEAAGGTTNVTLPFVAYRVADEGLAGDLIRQLQALVEEMVRVLYGDAPDRETLVEYEDGFGRVAFIDEGDLRDFLEFARDVERLHAALIRTGACGLAPPGYESGLVADDFFLLLFTQAVAAHLEVAPGLSTYELVRILTLAARVGVFGASSPLPDLGREIADRLTRELGNRAGQANREGDTRTIRDILAAAEQAGLTELADRARGYL